MNCVHHWLLESTTCRCPIVVGAHFHGACKLCGQSNTWPSLLFWWDALVPEDYTYAKRYGHVRVRDTEEELV